MVESDAVDRTVHRLFDQGVAATAEEDTSGSHRQLLFGMCLAYVAMCSRVRPTLPQLISSLRKQIPLGVDDPAIRFGEERIAHAILLTIISPQYIEEAESLLAACFAKGTNFTVPKDFVALLDDAMNYVSRMTGPADCQTVLQKLYIIAQSPVIAEHLVPYITIIDDIAHWAGSAGMKYYSSLSALIKSHIPPPPESDDSAQLHEPTDKRADEPVFEEHSEKQLQPEKPQEMLGLPPSDERSEMN